MSLYEFILPMPKLADNLQVWEVEARVWLEAHDLWDVVEISINKSANEALDYKRNNARARFAILSAVKEGDKAHLSGETTAGGMWKKLEDLYGKLSISQELRLVDKFHEYAMKTSDSIDAYLKERAAQWEKVKQARGETISWASQDTTTKKRKEQEYLHAILKGIRRSDSKDYDLQLGILYNLFDEQKLSVETIRSQLTRREEELNALQNNYDSALKISHQLTSNSRNNCEQNNNCLICERTGHGVK